MYRGSNRVLWLPQPCRPSQPPSDPYPPFCSPSAPLPTSSPWHSLTRHLRVSSIFGSWLLFVCLFVYLLTYLCIKQQYSSLKKAYAKAQHVRGINKKKNSLQNPHDSVPGSVEQSLSNSASLYSILTLFPIRCTPLNPPFHISIFFFFCSDSYLLFLPGIFSFLPSTFAFPIHSYNKL